MSELSCFRSDIGSQISVHHLLTHTSGLPNYTALPGFMADVSHTPFEVEEFVTTYCSGDLEFEPGSKFRYSNSGYFVLGAIIEQVAEESYEQQLTTRILEPLEMRDSLGEAYMTAGETELAIQNYAKSLELNPENNNAVRQLMRLTGVGE